METQNASSSKNPNFKNQPKWVWASVLGLAGLAVVASAVYVLVKPKPEPEPLPSAKSDSKTLDELEGWQTYRNEEYGFEFKYPLIYEIKDTEIYKQKEIDPSKACFWNVIIYHPDGVNYYNSLAVCLADKKTVAAAKKYCENLNACSHFPDQLRCEGDDERGKTCSEYFIRDGIHKRGRIYDSVGNRVIALEAAIAEFVPNRIADIEVMSSASADDVMRKLYEKGDVSKGTIDIIELFNIILSTFKFIE